MEFWTIILSFLIILLTYYHWKKENVFEKHKIPHIKPLPLLGNMGKPLFRLQSLIHSIQNVYNLNKDAKYVGYFDFVNPVYVIRDPELIKSLGVKNFDHFVDHREMVNPDADPLFANNLFSLHGDKWRRIRNVMSPAFTSSKMKGMFKLMMDCAENTVDYFIEESKKTGSLTINSKDAFTRYTNDVIGKCAFGVDIDSMRNRNNDFYILGRKSANFEGVLALKSFLLRSFPSFSKIFGIKLIDAHVEDFFYDLVDRTIKMRDETGFSRPDMIQLMMETRNKPGPKLTIQEMTAQAFVFFLAGFDTTALLLCFATHEIAANPEVQKRLKEEVDQVSEKFGKDLTYDAINGMEYLDAVINEAARMYPIGFILDRECTKPFDLPPALPDSDPVTLKVGDYIWLPVHALQRDPEYFSEPDKFLPERFMDSKLANSPFYIPFGVGPRMCIGNRFALLEIKVLIFNLMFKCVLEPGRQTGPLKLSKADFSMTAEGGFRLKLSPRSKSTP